MKPVFSILVLVGLFGLAVYPSQAGRNVRFSHLSLKEGLSQSTVSAIIQDHQGFMWFGTEDGLNRFDGYEFKVYKNRAGDLKSLSESWISSLCEDQNQDLWVGTFWGGLNRFDRHTEQFERYLVDDGLGLVSDLITCMLSDSFGNLWLGTHLGLHRYIPESNRFRYIPLSGSPGEEPETIKKIIQHSNGDLWVASERAVAQFRLSSDAPPLRVRHIEIEQGRGISEDRSGNIWVLQDGSLWFLDLKKETLERHSPQPDIPPDYDIYVDSEDGLWMCTDQSGLIFLAADRETYRYYQHDASDPYSLSIGATRRLMEDQDGVIWIGTYAGGVDRFDARLSYNFLHYRHHGPFSLDSDMVYTIYEDGARRLWVGTDQGLNRWDTTREDFVPVRRSDGKQPLSDPDVWAMVQEGEDHLWIGTYGGGLNYLDLDTLEARVYRTQPNDPTSMSTDMVTCILRDSSGRLLIGSDRGFNIKKGERFLRVGSDKENPRPLSNYIVTHMIEDAEANIWISTYGGLNLWRHGGRSDSPPDSFEIFRHDTEKPGTLCSDTAKCLLMDREGILWIGTQSGLSRFDPATRCFTSFSTEDGLPNNVVYGLVQDHDGMIWLSTNRGLARLDPHTNVVDIFDVNDGLQSNEFNRGAYGVLGDGRLAFGGIGGLNLFHPGRLNTHQRPPQIALVDIRLDNHAVPLQSEDSSSPLVLPINETERLRLGWRQQSLSLGFAALHFGEPERNRYQYKLDGFNRDWISSEASHRRATYTNLDAGRYTFKVKASNRDGIWSDPRTLEIFVEAPPWQRPWAYSLYLLLLVLALYLYNRGQRRIQNRLEEKVALRVAQLNRQNVELQARNEELEVLDEIVEYINRQVDLGALTEALLARARQLLGGADAGLILLLNDLSGRFEYKASFGLPEEATKYSFPAEELLESYRLTMEEVLPGIWIGHDYREKIGLDYYGPMRIPKTLFTISLTDGDQVVGVLNLHSWENADAFRGCDSKRVRRLREHAIIAVTKLRALKHLAKTQRQLLKQAHEAGMAEIVQEVLHHMGNTINSTQTSIHVLRQILTNPRDLVTLGNLAKLLREHGDVSDFMNSDKGQQFVEIMGRLYQNLDQKRKRLLEETGRLEDLIDCLTATLREQQRYAVSGGRARGDDLGQMISEVLQMNGTLLRDKNITVVNEMVPLPPVRLNPAKFRRIFLYLIQNAWESIEERGGGGRIWIKAEEVENRLVIRLCDDGVGIEPRQMAQIFSGFTSKGRVRGLGLHYCANALKEMGGDLSLESGGSGEGACAVITLPLKVPELAHHDVGVG